MMKILTKEESFMLLQRKFAELKEFDVIDLCYKDERYPAIVSHVDHPARSFRVLPMKREVVEDLIKFGLTNLEDFVKVQLPDDPSHVHPMWNKIGE